MRIATSLVSILLPTIIILCGLRASAETSDMGKEILARISVTFTPEKKVYDQYDPIAFHLTITNRSPNELLFKVGGESEDGKTSAPQTLLINLSHESGKSGPHTMMRLAEPDGPMTSMSLFLPSSGRAVYQTLAANGGSLTFNPMIDSAFLLPGRDSLQPGAWKTTVTLTANNFSSPQDDMAKSLRRSDLSVSSPPAEFNTTHTLIPGTRDYYDYLNWWEWKRLSLAPDGRFTFRSFSDAGGERKVVKGTYTETSESITLLPVVNKDEIGFDGRTVWTKTWVEKWPVLVPGNGEGRDSRSWPTLYEIDAASTQPTPRQRPWDAQHRSR